MTFPSFPLLSQRDEIHEGLFCDADNIPDRCKEEIFCLCPHIIKVVLNSTIELILFDENPTIRQLSHPWHLHGHQMILMGMGQFMENMTMKEIRERLQNDPGFLSKMPEGHVAPIKDTISIPSRGYALIRFRASNPGFWLIHCHFEWHLATGMGFIFQVGELEDMSDVPENFPKCGDYVQESRDYNNF